MKEKKIKKIMWGLVNQWGNLYSYQFWPARYFFKSDIKQAKEWGYKVKFRKFKIEILNSTKE